MEIFPLLFLLLFLAWGACTVGLDDSPEGDRRLAWSSFALLAVAAAVGGAMRLAGWW